MNKIIKVVLIVIFFVLLSWAVNLPFAKAGEPKEPTITVPYTEEQMCKAFLRAEICDMSQEEQEQYLLEMFRALIEQKLNEEKEIESMEICFKETEQGKLIPCEGMDI